MDKLKIFLAVAKKHQFWICCGVILVTSLVCWWLATGSVAQRFGKRKTEIDADFTGANVPPGSPNEKAAAKIKEQDEALKLKVYNAWETLYTQQKKNNPFPTEVLGKDFEKEFESLQLPKGELDPKYLERYQNYIKKYLPTLEKIVNVRKEVVKEGATPAAIPGARPDVRRLDPRARGMMMPPMPGMQPGTRTVGPVDPDKEYTGIVDWDELNLSDVLKRFDWGGDKPPTTLEVVLAQEDLWVYEALLRAIKKVNTGATTQANAYIKRINAIDIGKDCAKSWEDARKSVFAPGKATGGMMPGGGPMGRSGMPPGADGMNRPGGQQQLEQNLFKDRYVDEKGQPLPYEAEYPHAKHPIDEFKMMPIRLSVEMDQRRIPSLLVECANSNMPIEVRRVRVLKETIPAFDPGTTTPGGGSGAGREIPGSGMVRQGVPGRIGRPDAGTQRGGTGSQDAAGQVDVPVEIYAIIYIYNPPNRTKLGIPEKKAAEAAPAVVPGAGQPGNAATTQPSPGATPGK